MRLRFTYIGKEMKPTTNSNIAIPPPVPRGSTPQQHSHQAALSQNQTNVVQQNQSKSSEEPNSSTRAFISPLHIDRDFEDGFDKVISEHQEEDGEVHQEELWIEYFGREKGRVYGLRNLALNCTSLCLRLEMLVLINMIYLRLSLSCFVLDKLFLDFCPAELTCLYMDLLLLLLLFLVI
ncbi:hypothetical protein M9H77_16783 [Catharanthus roseus]|uniref:Uncharacterized protein n=1 Tax=Catharanthus roseus TaxID=4058 RepID=A0ACC0B2R7_CATRO|nr:hypothetical protein M9H77_16783 [Catharanthus roseus]